MYCIQFSKDYIVELGSPPPCDPVRLQAVGMTLDLTYLVSSRVDLTTPRLAPRPCQPVYEPSIMAPFDLDACIEKLKNKQLLGEALLREICEKTKEVLMRESNVVHVSSPVTVVGDIHGQFHDLIEIFRIGGSAPNTNYLFLGTQVPPSSLAQALRTFS